jgi:predicted DNA-binding transcriptional regulator AlpA
MVRPDLIWDAEMSANTLDTLPAELGRERIVDNATAAKFVGISLPHWNRLRYQGKTPKPVRLGDRKLGYSIGSLIDHAKAKQTA